MSVPGDRVVSHRSILSCARRQADWVLVNVHNHEWDPAENLGAPAHFLPPFARACIDAGADVFVAQGSHALLRGLEIYKNKPIFYDPGDFMAMMGTVSKLPADSYFRPGYGPEVRDWRATTSDGCDAREALPKPLSPAGGYRSARVFGSVVAVCAFDGDRKITELKLYPFTLVTQPRSQAGLPLMAD